MGRHAMQITGDGVVVWPRTEALPLPDTLRMRGAGEKAGIGIQELDAMLHGGLPAGSSTVVLGPTGAGKTCLALHFLAGCSAEEPGVMLTFYETPAQLLARAAGIAPHVTELAERGAVTFLWQGPAEDVIDRVATDLLDQVRHTGARRVVIDGLLGFEDMTLQPDRIVLFYRALTAQLRELGATTLCTAEVPELVGPVSRPPLSRLTPIAENLIMLRNVEDQGSLRRVVSVMKIRDSTFDTRLRRFDIGPGGIVLERDDAAASTGPDDAGRIDPTRTR
jgi:circadian clock protein KaiC